MCSRITATKSLSFCMTTFRASLTNRTGPLPQSHDCSCYVSRRSLAPPPLWQQKHTDLRAHDVAHSAGVWHQPGLANVTCTWRWKLCGITPAIVKQHSGGSCCLQVGYVTAVCELRRQNKKSCWRSSLLVWNPNLCHRQSFRWEADSSNAVLWQ
jgi:hypothetical protein